MRKLDEREVKALETVMRYNAATTDETVTWCNDCGAPMEEESECKSYDMLRIRTECLREFLMALGLTLKAKGPNILVVDKDGHEVNL